jgi:MFS family permease
MIAFILSCTDRQVLSLLIEPIKQDLKLSDTEFGLLQGLAFSIFYAIVGIPIAGLSDRRSRPAIIAAGVLVWSVATMACGLARGYIFLLIARMGVGTGEATLSPATYSLIPDLFPPENLGKPTAIYSLGSFLGAGFAFIVGGLAIALLSGVGALAVGPFLLRPWQIVMMAVGAPGVLLALVFALTVADPRKTFASTQPERPQWGDVLRFLMTNRGIFLPHILGYSFSAIALFGLLSWSPAYLIRVHHLSPQQAGLVLGSIAILCNGSGVLLAGALIDRRQQAGHDDGSLRVGVHGALGLILPLAILPFFSGLVPCLVALALAMFFASWPMPPSATLIQRVAPPAMRSRISAIFLFFNSLIGLGVGAAVIGMLNDTLFPNAGGVGLSLPLTAGVAAVLAALTLRMGIKPLAAFLREQRHWVK